MSKSVVRQMVKSMVSATEEIKIAQSGTSGNTATTGAIAGITNTIVQGDGISERTGLKILMKSLNMKFQATINTAATSDRVRVIVFADTENQNALPIVTEILASAALNSWYNVVYAAAGRFKVLYDSTIQLNTAGAAGAFRTVSIPVKDWPVFYNTSTGYGKNNLFFLEISDTGTNLATFAVTFDMRYSDA